MRPEDCDLAAGKTSADEFDAFMETIAGKIGDWLCANRDQIAREKISSIKVRMYESGQFEIEVRHGRLKK